MEDIPVIMPVRVWNSLVIQMANEKRNIVTSTMRIRLSIQSGPISRILIIITIISTVAMEDA